MLEKNQSLVQEYNLNSKQQHNFHYFFKQIATFYLLDLHNCVYSLIQETIIHID